MEDENKIIQLAAKYINNTNRHLFLTGKAGTGKTTFLTDIRHHTYKSVVVAAPTGIAAINAGGVTLHSLFHLPFGTYFPENVAFRGEQVNTPQTVLSQFKMNNTKRKLLREMELLIIDEVSMLRADLLDCIDLILRHVRRRKQDPFGGVQLLLIGDLHQLPPVVKNHEWELLSSYYNSIYFFDARALRENSVIYIELEKIYRQSDQHFIDVLNRLRNNELAEADLTMLNSLYRPNFEPADDDGFIHVTTHNHKAGLVNSKKLAKLDTETHVYQAEISGDFPEPMYPVEENLALKVGAQVMFIKNDSKEEKQFYNGKIGRVKALSKDEIIVVCSGDEEISLEHHRWDNIKYSLNKETEEIEENSAGAFSQFPLQLAWAITVHKSQGLTFDKAILDLSDVFAPGQMYVALSRLRSLEGLVLASPISESVFKKNDVIYKFSEQKNSCEILQERISTDTKSFVKDFVVQAFDFRSILQELSWHEASFKKEDSKSPKQQYLAWTRQLIDRTRALKVVGDKFNLQVIDLTMLDTEDYLKPLSERLPKAADYFLPLLSELESSIVEQLEKLSQRKRIKGYTKEVKDLLFIFSKREKLITRAQLLVATIADNRILTKDEVVSAYPELKISVKPTKGKKDKTPTKDISYSMYKEGASVKDIAKERGLVESTILGHLSHFVGIGKLEVRKFLDDDKLKNILTVAEKLETKSSGEIKSKLGEEYSYVDIKFAIAHLENLNK